MRKVLIFGGIGAASTIAGAMLDAEKRCGYKEYSFSGYINDKDNIEKIGDFPVVGGLSDIEKLIKNDFYFIYTIYKIDGMHERVDLFRSLGIPQDRLATFIHPNTFIAPDVEIDSGCVVMPYVTISSGAKLGLNCRLMSGAMLGHDTILKAHSFLAARSCLGSHIVAGTASYFGLNSTVNGKLLIADYSVIGMGAVVTKNTEHHGVYVGNPASFLRRTRDYQLLD